MLTRFSRICLVVLLIFALSVCAVFPVLAQEDTASMQELLDAFPLQEKSYTYLNGEDTDSAYVYYSHALLLQDATSVSGALAKASVALSMAAYSQDSINSLMSSMEFDLYDNTTVYDRSNNKLTLYDNDYVAYTIGHTEVTHPVTGETYVIYCVPIKGTSSNAEWFSNFNLGTSDEHEGFRQASLEVYAQLMALFPDDGATDSSHRIVWLTGHSRGAACANLIAGWLSASGQTYTQPERVFGYTFACPAVSLNADTSLTNIYNFNNIGDLIPMLPLADWGYQCYGQTIIMDASQTYLQNVSQRFKSVTGETYAGEASGDNYKTLLSNTLGSSRDVYNNTATLQLVLGLGAWGLGGKNSGVTWQDLVLKYLPDTSEIISEIDSAVSLSTLHTLLNGRSTDYDDLAAWAEQAYADTAEMTDEEFTAYLTENAVKVEELEEAAELTVISPSSFQLAQNTLTYHSYNIVTVADTVDAAMDLFCDSTGEIGQNIFHAHTQSTYVIWVNAMYYGYRGWMNSSSLAEAHIDSTYLSVGQECFKGSTGLTKLTIDESSLCVGSGAFNNCTGLREVTLPVDFDHTGTPFSGTTGVTTIHYTVGTDGVMPDRTSSNYSYGLEYTSRNSIQSIDFEEGITHIGDYLFYSGSSSLTDISFPDSLESIGSYAFSGCSSLSQINLPEGLTSLGTYVFSNCDSLTQLPELPGSLTALPEGCFQGCDGFTTLSIPETLTSIGVKAFYECSNLTELTLPDTELSLANYVFGYCQALRTVTLPVDYDITNSPFDSDYYDHETSGVTTIHYTVGSDGIMPDRNGSSCLHGLEYTSRHSIQCIDFEEGITHIGNDLFYKGSFSLTDITFPDSLESIGDRAFYGCIALKTLNLPIVTTGSYAFAECTSLTEIYLPEGITSLGNYVFKGCRSLTQFPELPASLTELPEGCFYSCGLTTLSIPETVTSLGVKAFYECSNLTELTLPDTELSLANYVFGYCQALRTVTLPVDYDVTNYPFDTDYYNHETSGVTTIHYTVGADGTMPNRNSGNCTHGLEYTSRNSIQSIDFEEGITHISAYLFYYGSSSLTSIAFPDSLESIGAYAFNKCTALETLDLPSASIGSYAFANCTALKTLDLPLVTTGSYAFSGCSSLSQINLPEGLTSLGTYVFSYCDSLTELPELPSSLTAIPDGCFYDCDGFTVLSIPDTLTSIGTKAFYECSNLNELTLPDTELSLANYVFGYCQALRTVTLPVDYDITNSPFGSDYYNHETSGVTTIHYTLGTDGAMPDRTTSNYKHGLEYTSRNSIQSIGFEAGITHIGDYLFYSGSSSLTDISFPDSLESIGNYAFYVCSSLSQINLPEGLTSLGTYVFSGCDSLTELPELPASLTSLPEGCFQGCDGFTTLSIPETVTSIGIYAFRQCANLTELTLPDSYISLGRSSFSDCSALTTVTLPVDYDFSNNPFGRIIYAPCVTTIHYTVGTNGSMTDRTSSNYSLTLEYQCRGTIQSIDFEEGVTHIGNYLFYGGSYGDASVLSSISFPDSLESIGSYAFHNCDALETLDLPLVTTGSYAFNSCSSLSQINLPEGLTSLGTYVFSGCDSLTELPELPSSLTTLPEGCFQGCDGFTTLSIPETVTNIGIYAFRQCANLTELTLPDSYISLGRSSFSDCSALTTVTLPVDYDFSNNPFGRIIYAPCVTTIHYTVGTNGSMTDRTSSNYSLTLEYQCRGTIQSIDFEEGVTHIGNYLFYGGSYGDASVLSSISFPDSLESIGNCAFHDCDALSSVMFTGDAPSIASNAFSGSVATCYYPGDNDTWTEDVLLDYGGDLTWVAYGSETPEDPCAEGHDYADGICTRCGAVEVSVTLGDVNGDGEIDLLDANTLILYYNEITDLTEEQLLAADVNGDEEIDILDAKLIISFYNELIDIFPAEV